MKGRIYTEEKCPLCGGVFFHDEKRGGLFCKQHPQIAAGRQYIVRGNRNSKGFEIENSDNAEITLSGCVKTFAYWDPSILKARKLLNSQTGEIVDVRVEALGEETVPVRGQLVRANRYRLHSELGEIDLWYAVDGYQWLALQSTTDSGRKLSYRMY